MADLTKLDIGRCTVTCDSVDLGETDGGVKVSIKKNVEGQTVDRFGKTPVLFINNGDILTIEANIAEFTIANLAIALGATIQDGTIGDKLVLGSQAGGALASHALTLHPVSMGAATDKDWVIYKAVVVGDIDVEYTQDKKKVLKITFQAIPDDTKTDGNKLCHFGVTTIS